MVQVFFGLRAGLRPEAFWKNPARGQSGQQQEGSDNSHGGGNERGGGEGGEAVAVAVVTMAKRGKRSLKSLSSSKKVEMMVPVAAVEVAAEAVGAPGGSSKPMKSKSSLPITSTSSTSSIPSSSSSSSSSTSSLSSLLLGGRLRRRSSSSMEAMSGVVGERPVTMEDEEPLAVAEDAVGDVRGKGGGLGGTGRDRGQGGYEVGKEVVGTEEVDKEEAVVVVGEVFNGEEEKAD